MIEISVKNMETMNAAALMRIAGMFQCIAQYSHNIEMQMKAEQDAIAAERERNRPNGFNNVDMAQQQNAMANQKVEGCFGQGEWTQKNPETQSAQPE
jgi:hypothetical protein